MAPSPLPAVENAASRRFRLRAFRSDTRGATAVEFALLAIPFFLLLFAILETFLFFFASQTVSAATQAASRLIRTGQAQALSYTDADFKDAICRSMAGILNCAANLRVDVRTVATFGAVDLAPPFDDDGNLDPQDFDYDDGVAGDIVVVRAYYEWPINTDLLGIGLANLGNGGRLIAVATAFRNEPF
ncbi:MAG: pilus assembly protein [Bauldia sp.]|nr:pilus assembly protein [Bauldia sp.]MCW5717595.1 pilus assembly protein [Bauldia sp.]